MKLKYLEYDLWQKIVSNEHVKRGLEVALTGSHSVLVIVFLDNMELFRNLRSSENLAEMEPEHLMGLKTPCPCGYYKHPKIPCTCSLDTLRIYQQDISKDTDIYLESSPFSSRDIFSNYTPEKIAVVNKRIVQAKKLRNKWAVNPDIEESGINLLKTAYERKPYIGIEQVIDIAKSVACLDNETKILRTEYISEAIQYQTKGE